MRSVKLNNNDYLDSTGIVHDRAQLSDIIAYSLRTWNENLSSPLNDRSTMTRTVRNNGVYLYVNSHITLNCVLLVMTWVGGNTVQVLQLASSNSDAIPNFSLRGHQLTITAPGNSRGYLIDLGSFVCA